MFFNHLMFQKMDEKKEYSAKQIEDFINNLVQKQIITELEAKNINHHPNVKGGILEKECSEIISNYFKSKRK